MQTRLTLQPLTPEAFAPFGEVIEASSARRHFPINAGTTTRYHALALADVDAAGRVFFEKQPVTLEQLEQLLREKLAQNRDLPVYLSGDAATPHGAALPLAGGCCQLGTCGRDRLPSSRARVKIGKQGHWPGNCGAGNGKRVAAAEKAAKAGLGISRKNPVNLSNTPSAAHPYCPPRVCGKLRRPA